MSLQVAYLHWFSSLCIAGILDLHNLRVREKFTEYFSGFLRLISCLLFNGNILLNCSLFMHFIANLFAKALRLSLNVWISSRTRAALLSMYFSFSIILHAHLWTLSKSLFSFSVINENQTLLLYSNTDLIYRQFIWTRSCSGILN